VRALVAISILAGILFQTTAKLAVILQFRANQDYIAKNLCVNRSKPKSCCKGSCQLNKKLEETDKKENRGLPANLKDKFNFFACTIPERTDVQHKRFHASAVFTYDDLYSYDPTRFFFHPPDLLS
jgi:hypothetical protein